MKSKVVLLYLNNYEDDVDGKIAAGLEMLGGLSALIGHDEKVLFKPNMLMGASPEKAMTTHPAVFEAVIKAFKEAGYANLFYGDGPGMPMADIEKVAFTCGLKQVADAHDIPMADFKNSVKLKNPGGRKAKEYTLFKAATDADAIISLCKMKTHALENITGAVKNQYGLVFQANKALGHAKYPNSQSFADMIVDLNKLLKPRLYIMDGIMAMEGNGPSAGDPTPMNVILMSADPVALDTVFAHLVYLDPKAVPTCVYGANKGLGTMNEEDITIETEDGEISLKEAAGRYGNPNFNVKRETPKFWRAGFLFKFLKRKNPEKSQRPVVDLQKCVGCGICEKACPVEGKAVHSGNGKKAEYDYKKCIRCYCCQEMCPAKAISKKTAGEF